MKVTDKITIVIEIFGCDSYLVIPINNNKYYRCSFGYEIDNAFEDTIEKIKIDYGIVYSNIKEIREYIMFTNTRQEPYNFLPYITEENVKLYGIKNYCKIKDANKYFKLQGKNYTWENLDVKYEKEIVEDYNDTIEENTIQENKIEEKLIEIDVKTYLMKDKANNYYKIGKSKNPKYREKTLQSEKPTIEIVKVWNKNIERILHNKYADYRCRGEWFKLNDIQVKYICKHF